MNNGLIYFDAFGGLSGNMILGAIVDAGVELARLEAELASLHVHGYALKVERVRRGPFAATHLDVELTQHDHPHRRLADILQIIDGSTLAEGVKAKAAAIFQNLTGAKPTSATGHWTWRSDR